MVVFRNSVNETQRECRVPVHVPRRVWGCKDLARCLADLSKDDLEHFERGNENDIQLWMMPTVASRSRSSVIASRSSERTVRARQMPIEATQHTDCPFVAQRMEHIECIWISLLVAPNEVDPLW